MASRYLDVARCLSCNAVFQAYSADPFEEIVQQNLRQFLRGHERCADGVELFPLVLKMNTSPARWYPTEKRD